ncbi:MAG: hypothetical protein AB7Q17_09725 [Phycisphaerae bacterium]
MKKFLIVLAGLALTTGAANAADLRLFFSSDDPFAGTGRTPPTLPGNVAGAAGMALNSPTVSNPVLTNAGGRLHMWGTGTLGDPDPNVWNGVAINIVIAGPATITGGGGLNITSPTLLRRWETGSDLTPPTFNFIAVTRAGLQLPPIGDGFDDGADSVYLGYVDVIGGGAGASELRFQVGNAGISRSGGDVNTDMVFFGADNQGLRGDAFGQTSTEADATIQAIPEPAGLLLLGLAGLALRRRV